MMLYFTQLENDVMPMLKKKIIDEQVELCVEEGIVIRSPYSSPIVFVSERDVSTRLCCD